MSKLINVQGSGFDQVSWKKFENSPVLEPYYHIARIPGKQFRSSFIEGLNQWFKLPLNQIQLIQETISMLHNISLLLDDIEDDSKMRRGVPVAHSIFSLGATVIAANVQISSAFLRILEEFPQDVAVQATAILLDVLVEMHQGQYDEIMWRESGKCPSEAAYSKMVERKTGGIFDLIIKWMKLLSQDKDSVKLDYSLLIKHMGNFYQIRDDYANLKSGEYETNKGCFAEDLSEGKFSFPIIYAVHHASSDNVKRLLNIMKQHTDKRETKEEAIKILEESGSFEYTQNQLNELYAKIQNEIAKLGGNAQLTNLLKPFKKIK